MLSKKLISWVLALALVFSIAVLANAPITLSGEDDVEEVDVVENDDGDEPDDKDDDDDDVDADVKDTDDRDDDDLYFWMNSAEEIAKWETMATPSEDGGGQGSVEMGDDAAIISAAVDGWGGVQSEEITLDLSKEPLLFIQIKENPDPFKWGAKFTPTDPVIEDHEWGFYLAEDNNFKHNNYAVIDIADKLGEDIIELYGEEITGHIWIMAAGGPEATVEVSSVKMLNQADQDDDFFTWSATAEEIAGYEPMATPSDEGGGQGSVEAGDDAAVISAAFDGWGGVQSEEITLDLSDNPFLLIQIKENNDPFKWGAKFTPTDPIIEDHEWGFYLAEDNNFKHNNYAGIDIAEKLGEDIIELYGEEITGHIWFMAAGGPEATVEIASVKIFNQD